MIEEREVLKFLTDFKQRMQVFGVLFRDDRNKNFMTLSSLGITPKAREEVLFQLDCRDYCEGPIQEILYKHAEMWVFGKIINAREVYIKISMGFVGVSVICISFHIAEYPLKYPFAKK